MRELPSPGLVESIAPKIAAKGPGRTKSGKLLECGGIAIEDVREDVEMKQTQNVMFDTNVETRKEEVVVEDGDMKMSDAEPRKLKQRTVSMEILEALDSDEDGKSPAPGLLYAELTWNRARARARARARIPPPQKKRSRSSKYRHTLYLPNVIRIRRQRLRLRP